MHEGDVPIARDTYLMLAYGTDQPKDWNAEREDALPRVLQRDTE